MLIVVPSEYRITDKFGFLNACISQGLIREVELLRMT